LDGFCRRHATQQYPQVMRVPEICWDTEWYFGQAPRPAHQSVCVMAISDKVNIVRTWTCLSKCTMQSLMKNWTRTLGSVSWMLLVAGLFMCNAGIAVILTWAC
jgi:hypothetical protein